VKLLALWIALVFAVPALADVEVYRPLHRAGADLVPLVEAALGPEGSVAVDGNTGALVMVGSAAAIAQALELLAVQDRPLRTVFIEHETRTLRDLEASGQRVVWSVGGGSLRVGNVESTGSGASLRLGGRNDSRASHHGSALRVLEGEWGRISQGSEVLLPIGSARHPDAVRVAADSGLEVRPRILGDGRVRLDLRPFQARLRPGGAVAQRRATTTLVVTPGRPAVVGGIGRSGAGSTSALGGGSTRGAAHEDTLLVVWVTLDEDPSAPK
jgi:type II secretory pathway component HofQ